MKATSIDLERRAQALPSDFVHHVLSWKGNLAKVKSFSSDAVYSVSIMKGTGEGELRCTCTCASVKVCVHIVSFYAAAKNLSPAKKDTDEASEATRDPSEKTRGVDIDGLALIAEAIEKLVDGVTLIVTERIKKETVRHAKDNVP